MFGTDKNFEIIGTEVYHKLTNKLIVDLGKNGAALETPMCLLVRTSDQSKNYDMAFDCDGHPLPATGQKDCLGVFPCDKKYQIIHSDGSVENHYFPIVRTSSFNIKHDGTEYSFLTKLNKLFANGTDYCIFSVGLRDYVAVYHECEPQSKTLMGLKESKRWTLYNAQGYAVPQAQNVRSIRLVNNRFFVEDEEYNMNEVCVPFSEESYMAKRLGCLFATVVTCASWIAIAQLTRCSVDEVSVNQEIPTCSGLIDDEKHEVKPTSKPQPVKITTDNVLSQQRQQHVYQ